MIDWLTLRLPRTPDLQPIYDKAAREGDKVFCVSHYESEDEAPVHPFRYVDFQTGECKTAYLKWEKLSRQSIRSDSHRLVVDPTPHYLWLHGSPARVTNGNNVFGKEDICECALDMINFASLHLQHPLTRELSAWDCTRVDVTLNYDLGSPTYVKQALSCLRQSEGGRHQVRTESETIYWNKNSQLRKQKAYHKGPHLLKQFKKGEAEATYEQLELAQNLLRLELTLASQFWRERSIKPWFDYSAIELENLHEQHFRDLIGSMEITEMDDIRTKCIEASQRKGWSDGYGLAAYRTWCQIKSMGLREVEETTPKRTWARHKAILLEAGFSYADFHAQNIIPFRRRTVDIGKPVRDWDEITRAA